MSFLADSPAAIFGALITGSVFKYTALAWISRRKNGVERSRGSEYVGTVSGLMLYPVKSARELQDLKSARLTKHGLKYKGAGDRHWLVTKPDGTYYNLNLNGRMTQIIPSCHDDVVHLDSVDMETLYLPINPEVDDMNIKTVKMRNTTALGVDCGDAAASWICTVLRQTGLRLLYSAPALNKRRSCTVHKDWATDVGPNEEIAFHDFVNCMVLSVASVDDLNKRLDDPVSSLNFRPNIMVDGTAPYQEDTWSEVYIGDTAHLRYVDNCVRCPITTIDPVVGTRNKEGQPVKELKTFRCYERHGPTKATMGIYFAVIAEGDVNVGDPVYAVTRR